MHHTQQTVDRFCFQTFAEGSLTPASSHELSDLLIRSAVLYRSCLLSHLTFPGIADCSPFSRKVCTIKLSHSRGSLQTMANSCGQLHLYKPFRFWYLRLDSSGHPRIIKDVMIRQSGDEKEAKKRRETAGKRGKTGSQESDPATDTLFDEIDPAEFFDPEEFGIRREARPYEP